MIVDGDGLSQLGWYGIGSMSKVAGWGCVEDIKRSRRSEWWSDGRHARHVATDCAKLCKRRMGKLHLGMVAGRLRWRLRDEIVCPGGSSVSRGVGGSPGGR